MGYRVKGKMILTYNKVNQATLALLLEGGAEQNEIFRMTSPSYLDDFSQPHGRYLNHFNWVRQEDEGETTSIDTTEIWGIDSDWYIYHRTLLDLLAQAGYEVQCYLEGQEHEAYWEIESINREIVETQLKLYKVEEIEEMRSIISKIAGNAPTLTQYCF